MNEQPLFGDSRLPEPLDARVRSELSEGEQLLWVGQPNPRRMGLSGVPMVLFGIPFTGFALFWMAAASGMLFGPAGGPAGALPVGFGAMFICFPLFGVPFVLVGLGMLTAPFWMWRRAKRVCYTLTDRRAIVWEPRFLGGVEVRSYGPSQLDRIRRTEYADGSGDLIFEEVVTFGTDAHDHTTAQRQRHGFFYIANVRLIEELLRKALRPDEAR
jgi:hypothetical protein